MANLYNRLLSLRLSLFFSAAPADLQVSSLRLERTARQDECHPVPHDLFCLSAERWAAQGQCVDSTRARQVRHLSTRRLSSTRTECSTASHACGLFQREVGVKKPFASM